MRMIGFILALVLIASSCSSGKKSSGSHPNSSVNSSVDDAANDGLSYDKAIVIKEKTERKGIDAEYKWLRKHFPGYTLIRQSLNFENNKNYDVLSIKTSEGEKKDIYFDISNFFGKW